VGICLSGGGIRSASYCLGALQSFESHGLLSGAQRAKYLTSVSGGSYIATAITTVAKGMECDGTTARPAPEGGSSEGPRLGPFAHGSPEEKYLRNNTLYLTHGRGGIPRVVWRIFLGVLFNVGFVALCLATASLLLGLFYAWAWPSLRAGCPEHCPAGAPFAIPTGLWWAVIAAGVLAVVFGLVWILWTFQDDDPLEKKAERWHVGMGSASWKLLGVTVVLLVFGIGIPTLIHLARPHYVVSQPVPGSAGTTVKATKTVITVGLLGVIGTWIAFATKILAKPSSVEKGVANAVKGFARKHEAFLVGLGATLFGPLLVLAGIVGMSYWGAAYPWSFSGPGRPVLIAWIVAVALPAVLWRRADVTEWSLYPLYRRRLSAGFVLERFTTHVPSPTAVGDQDARPLSYWSPSPLSESNPEDFPEVIICATVNISDYGLTPSGSNASSFTFSHRQMGGPLVGFRSTVDFQNALKAHPKSEDEKEQEEEENQEKDKGDRGDRGDLQRERFTTLRTAMAISGAAFSPSMGKMTHAPFRFLMALLNLRLGVWVPNPAKIDDFGQGGRFRRLLPRPQYLFREMFGRNREDRHFLYVTDGGHYDNLGLVELLRRKCKVVWCVDAAGDKVDSFTTLGGALQTASAELGVVVDISPETDMGPQKAAVEGRQPQFVKQPFCKGTITYADGETGVLILVKAGIPESAPLDVLAYASQHVRFPSDPTLDQLYDADRFDAYRELGFISTEAAIAKFGVSGGASLAETTTVDVSAFGPGSPPIAHQLSISGGAPVQLDDTAGRTVLMAWNHGPGTVEISAANGLSLVVAPNNECVLPIPAGSAMSARLVQPGQ